MKIADRGLGGTQITFTGEDPLKKDASLLAEALIKGLTFNIETRLQENISGFYNMTEFWIEVQKRRLLAFLQYSTNDSLVRTAKSLLYAFKYPGTYEGLIQLGTGIFGHNSTIIIESDEPAVLSLIISNANTSFSLALYQKENAIDKHKYTLAIPKKDVEVLDTYANNEDHFALCVADIGDAIDYDPKAFFKRFLTPGRVLKKVTIDYAFKVKDEDKQHNYTESILLEIL